MLQSSGQHHNYHQQSHGSGSGGSGSGHHLHNNNNNNNNNNNHDCCKMRDIGGSHNHNHSHSHSHSHNDNNNNNNSNNSSSSSSSSLCSHHHNHHNNQLQSSSHNHNHSHSHSHDRNDGIMIKPEDYHTGSCLRCKTKINSTRIKCDTCSIYICTGCHKCPEHKSTKEIRQCDRCENYFCKKCQELDVCQECNESHCSSCSTITECHSCHQYFCTDGECVTECGGQDCDAILCRQCGWECKFCSSVLCEDCSNSCGKCGVVVCKSDEKFLVECEYCELPYCLMCLAHEQPCVRCGKVPTKKKKQLVTLRLKQIFKQFKSSSNSVNDLLAHNNSMGHNGGKHGLHGHGHHHHGHGHHHGSSDESKQELIQKSKEDLQASEEASEQAMASLIAEIEKVEEEEAQRNEKKKSKKSKKKKKKEKGGGGKQEEETTTTTTTVVPPVVVENLKQPQVSAEQEEAMVKITPSTTEPSKTTINNNKPTIEDGNNKSSSKNITPVKSTVNEKDLKKFIIDARAGKIKPDLKDIKRYFFSHIEENVIDLIYESQNQNGLSCINSCVEMAEVEIFVDKNNSNNNNNSESEAKMKKGSSQIQEKQMNKKTNNNNNNTKTQSEEEHHHQKTSAEEDEEEDEEDEEENDAFSVKKSPLEIAFEEKLKKAIEYKDEETLMEISDNCKGVVGMKVTRNKIRKQLKKIAAEKASILEDDTDFSLSEEPFIAAQLPMPKIFLTQPGTEIDLDPAVVGWVIGKNGTRIKDMMEKSKCKMWVNQDVPTDKPRKLHLIGRKQEIDMAMKMVNELLLTAPTLGNTPSGGISSGSSLPGGSKVAPEFPSTSHTESVKDDRKSTNETSNQWGSGTPYNKGSDYQEIIECPASKVGLVIGSKGWTIKKIQTDSGAVISIDQTGTAAEAPKKIICKGSKEAVESAKDMVLDVLAYPNSTFYFHTEEPTEYEDNDISNFDDTTTATTTTATTTTAATSSSTTSKIVTDSNDTSTALKGKKTVPKSASSVVTQSETYVEKVARTQKVAPTPLPKPILPKAAPQVQIPTPAQKPIPKPTPIPKPIPTPTPTAVPTPKPIPIVAPKPVSVSPVPVPQVPLPVSVPQVPVPVPAQVPTRSSNNTPVTLHTATAAPGFNTNDPPITESSFLSNLGDFNVNAPAFLPSNSKSLQSTAPIMSPLEPNSNQLSGLSNTFSNFDISSTFDSNSSSNNDNNNGNAENEKKQQGSNPFDENPFSTGSGLGGGFQLFGGGAGLGSSLWGEPSSTTGNTNTMSSPFGNDIFSGGNMGFLDSNLNSNANPSTDDNLGGLRNGLPTSNTGMYKFGDYGQQSANKNAPTSDQQQYDCWGMFQDPKSKSNFGSNQN